MPLSARQRKINARRSRHNTHLKQAYGITIDDYDKLFAAQGGKCKICKGGTTKNFLAVDHNHKNGKVRGLLCGSCNGGLARFRDDIARLRAAVRYMKDDGATVEAILNEEA